MNEPNRPDDELDVLLAGAASCDTSSLREALRGQSTAAFVRRRRRRRVVRAAGMAACYLLGAATLFAWQHVSASPVERVADRQVAAPSDGDAVAAQEDKTSAGNVPDAASNLDAANHDASNLDAANQDAPPQRPLSPKPAKKTRFASLRELGDRHLLADRNPERALRCYRMALRYATEDERRAAAQDGTWLLRVICLDSTQEHEHGSKS